jgi:hypothetical protein
MEQNTTGPETGAETKTVGSPIFTNIGDLANDLEARRAAGLKLLTAAEIMDAPDMRFKVVPVPEWGGEVVVRALSGTERDAFEAGLVQQRGKERVVTTLNIRAKLCALTIVDPSDPTLRRRMFDDKQIAALGGKSAGALSRVYNEAADLSGISEKDAEELAGNSPSAGSDDLSSNSP